MKLLHTFDEINHLDQQRQLASKLLELSNEYNNNVIKDEANRIIANNQLELDKYNYLINTICYAPPSFLSGNKEYRLGVIEEITHFNAFSKSVRVKFRYDRSIGGGFNGHSLLQLKEIKP